MNEKQFTETLNHILEKDIPDDMDKLNSIRDTITKRNRIRFRRMQALSRVAAVIVTIFMLTLGSIAAYAMYQSVLDSGLENAIEQGLVQNINESQTIDGVTVTVLQAYADTERLAVWYTVEAGDISFNDMPLEEILSTYIMLTDIDVTGATVDSYGYDYTGSDTYLALFKNNQPVPEDGIYQFEFGITFGGPDQFAVDPDTVPADEQGDYLPDKYKITLPEIGPFTFDLDLTSNGPLVLNPDTTITSNGLDMTLKTVEIAPSQTSVELCYDLPDGNDWQPNVTLMLDDVPLTLRNVEVVGPIDPSQTNRCISMQFVSAYTGEEQQMSILADGLKTNGNDWVVDVYGKALEQLAEQGIIVEFRINQRGFTFDIIEMPEDMDEYDVTLRVWDALSGHYEGEWQFTLDLP